MRHSLNFRRLSNWLVRLKTSLRINQVRRENGVDESRLSKTSLSYSPLSRRHVLIEQASRQEANFREKTRYIPTTITLNWKPRFKSLCSICCVIVSKPTYDVARISPLSVEAMSSECRRTWRQEAKRWATTTDAVAKRKRAAKGMRPQQIQFGFRETENASFPFWTLPNTARTFKLVANFKSSFLLHSHAESSPPPRIERFELI